MHADNNALPRRYPSEREMRMDDEKEKKREKQEKKMPVGIVYCVLAFLPKLPMQCLRYTDDSKREREMRVGEGMMVR